MAENNRLPDQRVKLVEKDGLMSRPWYQFISNFVTKGYINPLYINKYARISAVDTSISIEVFNTTTKTWVTKVTYSE